MSSRQAIVTAVLRGVVQPLGRTTSAIDKRPVEGPVQVHALGLAGDAQADLRVHGGLDKALHCYAWHHYATWRAELQGGTLWDAPGAFGENLSIDGLDEQSVCIGDRWGIGTAVTVVTQGRQPCFKLNMRFGVADMAARVQQTLRAGWYLRVEQPGEIAAERQPAGGLDGGIEPVAAGDDGAQALVESARLALRGADGGGRHPGPIPPKSPSPAVPGGQQPFCPNRRTHHRTTGMR